MVLFRFVFGALLLAAALMLCGALVTGRLSWGRSGIRLLKWAGFVVLGWYGVATLAWLPTAW